MSSDACGYDEIIAANIRAARGRADLSQTDIAMRMASLGFSEWRFQTVGNIERGKRRVTAPEIMALAWVFGTTIAALMSPCLDDDAVLLPSGDVIAAESVRLSCGRGRNDRAVDWKDDGTPVFAQQGIIGA